MSLILAHRGASHLAPENTLSALRLAQDLGADGFEFDVQMCRSGELVLFHDRFPKRTTNYNEFFKKKHKGKKAPRKSIANLFYAELALLDAGLWKNEKYRGEKIPLLEDVFRMTRKDEFLDIEIKTLSVRNQELAARLVALLLKYKKNFGEAVITSFNPVFLKTFRELTKDFPIGLISEKKPPTTRSRKMWIPILKPEYMMLEAGPKMAEEISLYHRQRKKVMFWTVNTREEIKKAMDVKADGIITNHPEYLPIVL